MKRNLMRYGAPAAAAAALVLATACGAGNEADADGEGGSSDLSGELNGAGASSQEAAFAAWQKGFQTQNPDVTVNYDPVGSGSGREQFIAGGNILFAGSDEYFPDEELADAEERCGGDVVEVPVYVSPIAVIFNVEGVDSLNLSPETIGAIFSGDITQWNDKAIAADNPDADLPAEPITAVHRSDESGTTANFTDYLDQASGGSWSEGVVETWPVKSGEAAEGTSGVVSAVKNGQGTIGYADASQAGDLGVAKVQVGKEFVEYSPEAAAAALDASKPTPGRADTSMALDLNRTTTEAGVYPIVLASYGIACSEYESADEADLVKAWFDYVISSEGQQAAAGEAGSAPLSEQMSADAKTIVDSISSKE
ncbi:phosphate ABC transporter substrate-binding protein PstS [Solicola gregarius]|uniref:Phosphate-binding protein n=1 Tax=Solicola gregarius TaxID=2908642 RepID=A0AA46TE30_9ACTN|nr:phosphate ABC transporter substrate-binding protein PstS [Solicola gregarius]UYM03616.1 phosphate ABC transporter substrate-binding protein PstS [Solicola gregarius]